jgi:hypothetical protein
MDNISNKYGYDSEYQERRHNQERNQLDVGTYMPTQYYIIDKEQKEEKQNNYCSNNYYATCCTNPVVPEIGKLLFKPIMKSGDQFGHGNYLSSLSHKA